MARAAPLDISTEVSARRTCRPGMLINPMLIEPCAVSSLTSAATRKLMRPSDRTYGVNERLTPNCFHSTDIVPFVDETGSHLNIVHRDVSPSNMIISPMGHVKVIDFGIAKANSRQLHTETGSVKGKLGYMAPEVALGMTVGSTSDVFSAGVVAWELNLSCPNTSAHPCAGTRFIR